MAKLGIAANVAVDVLDGRIMTKKPVADEEDRQVDENDEDVLEPFVAASDGDSFLVSLRLVLFFLPLRQWLQLHTGCGLTAQQTEFGNLENDQVMELFCVSIQPLSTLFFSGFFT